MPLPTRSTQGSRLGRLYTYSKASAQEALENFTTEALALAIADDDRPIRAALSAVGAAYLSGMAWSTVATLRPRTQQYAPGGGFLDLVLEAMSDVGTAVGEVWIEVKIGAPESGNQIAAYLDKASGRATPTWLVTLGPAPLRDTVAHVSWMSLYQAARRTTPEHGSWRDLRMFLEEQMVASDALGPISDVEAGSLGPAFGLISKASMVVQRVHERIEKELGQSARTALTWGKTGDLLNSVAGGFRQTGEFVASGGPVRYGLTTVDGTAYWIVAVRPNRQSAEVERAVRAAAEAANLSPDLWERPGVPPYVIVARARATGFATHDQTVTWMLARLRDLDTSGVLAAASV